MFSCRKSYIFSLVLRNARAFRKGENHILCKAHKRSTGYMCNLARKPPEGTNEKKLGEEKNFFENFFAGKVFLWDIWKFVGARWEVKVKKPSP